MAGAPGRWLCRGCRLGGALLLSFSGRSSLSLLSRLSVLSLSWVLALGFGAAVSLCPLSWVLAFLCCPLVLACYALGLGAGLGWGRCWAVQAVAVVAGWGLVCGDLAGLGIVILHKYSLADLVIFQAKSDKF